MSKEIKGAILQRDKETYAIVPRIPMGVLTPEILEKLAEVARKYSCPDHQNNFRTAHCAGGTEAGRC